jgi:hypothetical protein
MLIFFYEAGSTSHQTRAVQHCGSRTSSCSSNTSSVRRRLLKGGEKGEGGKWGREEQKERERMQERQTGHS